MKDIALNLFVLTLSFFTISLLPVYEANADMTCTFNGKEVPCSELKEGFLNAKENVNNFLINDLKMSEADKQELKKSVFKAFIASFVMGIGMLLLQLAYLVYHLWMFIDCLIRFGSKRGLLALGLLFVPLLCIYYHFAIRNKHIAGPSQHDKYPTNSDNTPPTRKRSAVDANQQLLFK